MNGRKKTLAEIRKLMEVRGVDTLLVPMTDPHLGEYVPAHWRVIEWLTGFTGSAGTVLINSSFAGLWTDSRYFIQAEEQLKGTGYDLVKLKIPHTPEYIDWIAQEMKPGSKIAFDGRVIPVGLYDSMKRAFRKNEIKIIPEADFIYNLWDGRVPMPVDQAFEHDIKFAGKRRSEKLSEVHQRMNESGVDYHLLTSLDDIAWLLNIRGTDINFSPLFTSFALVGKNETLLFADREKVPEKLAKKLGEDNIRLLPYDQVALMISSLPSDSILLINPSTTSLYLHKAIPETVGIIEDVTIPTRLKAVKNQTEIGHIKNVMVKDGVALSKFFFWLEKSISNERITEISASEKLLSFRMQQDNCTGASFATIAGYNAHGALPHYCSTPETDVELKPEGIFLLDSGGQYLDGTTDVTRTIALGKPTARQRSDFTLALKGTINLALAKFPVGTRGYQIEMLARKALWDRGLNYGHGTGHGVGFFLNVHEGPQTIGTGASADLKTFFEPGMLTADEPAIYRVGEYGFRTENLILCVEDEKTDFGQFLKFETVTLCYIDKKLVDKNLMTDYELEWFNDYHQLVFEKISPFLDESEKEWLRIKTEAL